MGIDKNIFCNIGAKINIEGNTPLLLNDPDKIWIVEKGNIEIFSIKMKDNKPFGNRNYVYTVKENDGIFGLDKNNQIILIATGLHGTSLIEISKNNLKQLITEDKYKNEFILILNNWIYNLTNNFSNKIMPRRFIDLKEKSNFDLKQNDIALSKESVLWIKHNTGQSMLRDNSDFIFTKETPYFPVTGFSWITCIVDSNLEVLSTQEVLGNSEIFENIKYFNNVIINIIYNFMESADLQNQQRIKNRTENDNIYLENSLKTLAEIMTPGLDEDVSGFINDGVLFAAFKAVGQASRINIIKPQNGIITIKEISKASQIQVRRVLLKDNWYQCDSGPLLGFLEEDNRPVALLPISKTEYQIYDVKNNSKQKLTEETLKNIKPFAFYFYKPFPASKINIFQLLKFGFDSTWKSDIWAIILIGFLGGLVSIFTPIATGLIFSSILPQAERLQLYQIGLFLFVSAASLFLFQLTKSVAQLRVESRMDFSIQAAVWDRVLSLPVPFFKDYTSGDLAMRAISINEIRKKLSGSTMASLLAGIFSIFNFFLLFNYSKDLAGIASILVIISVAFTLAVGYFSLIYQRHIAAIDGKISGFILQIIGGIAKFRISFSEKRAFSLWAKKFAEKRKYRYKAESISNKLVVFNSVFPIICSLVIFYYALTSEKMIDMETGVLKITTGNFLAFNAAFVAFMTAMITLSSTLITVLAIIPLYERARPILESLPEYDGTKSDPGELEGSIEVSHINFRYHPDAPLILDDISININPGEFVAFVGPSGSGKSTLFRLLLGFETPESGAIYYDGQDLSSLDIRSVRSQMGVVLQNGKILSGDIFTNIIGSAAHLTIDDAWEAAEMAGLSDDIKNMPMGMHTVISEGGSTFSGGQRQRLLIARAIVNKPRIIYFDEATSALDNRTQKIVSESLEKMNATRVVIAHRLSTIINAEKIFLIDKGKLVQKGTYDELVNQEGPFKELAKRQIV